MITGATRVYALLGHPIARSPSPRIHNAWFAEHGIDAVYVALDTASDGASVVAAVRSLGLAGANVTIPLKERVTACVDRLEPAAEAAGAVNTLWWDDHDLVGANTDGPGFLTALVAAGIDPHGSRVVMLGAGGAARGIATALATARIRSLTVLNRTESRARRLVERLDRYLPGPRFAAGPLDRLGVQDADIVVSALPPGIAPDLDLAGLPRDTPWIDISYLGSEPATSTRARAAGLRVLDGWSMLIGQASLAFERWTGVDPGATSSPVRRC